MSRDVARGVSIRQEEIGAIAQNQIPLRTRLTNLKQAWPRFVVVRSQRILTIRSTSVGRSVENQTLERKQSASASMPPAVPDTVLTSSVMTTRSPVWVQSVGNWTDIVWGLSKGHLALTVKFVSVRDFVEVSRTMDKPSFTRSCTAVVLPTGTIKSPISNVLRTV